MPIVRRSPGKTPRAFSNSDHIGETMDKGLTRLLPVGAALAAIAIAGGIIVQRALADDSGDLIVPTLYGELQGKSLQTTDAWLGIPYARAPVGARRWQPPQPPEKWDGVKPAFQFGAACMQLLPGKGAEAALADGPMSEDCLTLNVWRPKQSSQSLPVMVWVHGGAFRLGSSSLALYNGEALAAKGVVVVSINYRLGPLSVFPHPALIQDTTRPINFGLLDQIAALSWIKRNIASFGGNPDNVTIWGESAGGASVGYLMASPLSAGLFNKAIIESGALDLPEPGRQQAQAELKTMLPGDLWSKNAQQLRALPATELLHLPLSKTAVMPVIDGVSLKEKTRSAFAAGHIHKVPLLIGSNNDEAGFFPPQWSASVPEKLGDLWPQAKALTDGYGTGRDELRAAQIATDKFATLNTRAQADAAAVLMPTWRYQFSYVSPADRGRVEGAIHTAEIPYVFGNLNTLPQVTAEDHRLAQTLMMRWVQFARSGDPNAPELPHWPRWQPDGDTLWSIGNQGEKPIKEPDAALLDFLQQHARFEMN